MAAVAINAAPTRGEPSDIAAKEITAIRVGGVDELDPLTWEIGLDLWHKEEQ